MVDITRARYWQQLARTDHLQGMVSLVMHSLSCTRTTSTETANGYIDSLTHVSVKLSTYKQRSKHFHTYGGTSTGRIRRDYVSATYTKTGQIIPTRILGKAFYDKIHVCTSYVVLDVRRNRLGRIKI